MERNDKKWDVFLSYASEDKEEVARPLAHYLDDTLGLRVWFDDFQLEVGDSLTQAIGFGLANCSLGIVVVSPTFMAKKWPLNELSALFALEGPSRGLILPIWHHVSEQEVARFNPLLADRVALKTSDGFDALTSALRRRFGRELDLQNPFSGYWYGASGRLLFYQEGEATVGVYDWYGKPWAGNMRGEIEESVFRFRWWWDVNELQGSGYLTFRRRVMRDGTSPVSHLAGRWWYGDTEAESAEGFNDWSFARDSWRDRVAPHFAGPNKTD